MELYDFGPLMREVLPVKHVQKEDLLSSGIYSHYEARRGKDLLHLPRDRNELLSSDNDGPKRASRSIELGWRCLIGCVPIKCIAWEQGEGACWTEV